MATGHDTAGGEARSWKTVTVFLFIFILGPPLGGLPVAVVGAVASFADPASQSTNLLAEAGAALALVGIFSYLFGGIQSLISAAWLAWVTHLHGGFTYSNAARVALIASLPALLVLVVPQATNRIGLAIMILGLGLFSALACRFILGLIGITPRVPAASG